jgi:signal peptidase I
MQTVDEHVTPVDATFTSVTRTEPERSRLRSALVEILQTVVLTLLIFFAVRSVVQNFRVEGLSMSETLHTGQYLLINKAVYFRSDGTVLDRLIGRDPLHPRGPRYLFGGPQRGDIIVFEAPGSTERDFIKRVIGMPGDTVRISRGKVFVNGQELDEPYIVHRGNYDLDSRKVPEGNYFVLGDNRPNSSDSHLGWFVTADSIIGRAWLSYWPPTTWGSIGHEDLDVAPARSGSSDNEN